MTEKELKKRAKAQGFSQQAEHDLLDFNEFAHKAVTLLQNILDEDLIEDESYISEITSIIDLYENDEILEYLD